MEKLLTFFVTHYEAIFGILLGAYEILIRVFPTGKNRSLIDLIWKIINVVLPNKKDDGTKRTIKMITLFILLSLSANAQLVGTFQAIRFGVGSPPSTGVDTTILNASPTVYPIGTLIREINTDSLFYKFPDGFWHPIGGGGGGGAAGNPAGSNNMVQYNNKGVFGASANFLYRHSTDEFLLGDTTKVASYFTYDASGAPGAPFVVAQGSDAVGLGAGIIQFFGNGLIEAQGAIDLEIRNNGGGNLQIGAPNQGATDTLFLGNSNSIGTYPIYLERDLWQNYRIDQATVSTAGGTVTLDQNNQFQRSFVGSASFATPKTIANSNVVATANTTSFFNFFFEVTNVAAVLTVPSDWLMSSPDFDGTAWTPPATGLYEFGGSFNNVSNTWNVKVSGPFQ